MTNDLHSTSVSRVLLPAHRRFGRLVDMLVDLALLRAKIPTGPPPSLHFLFAKTNDAIHLPAFFFPVGCIHVLTMLLNVRLVWLCFVCKFWLRFFLPLFSYRKGSSATARGGSDLGVLAPFQPLSKAVRPISYLEHPSFKKWTSLK